MPPAIAGVRAGDRGDQRAGVREQAAIEAAMPGGQPRAVPERSGAHQRALVRPRLTGYGAADEQQGGCRRVDLMEFPQYVAAGYSFGRRA